jgi:hypothetical protein
MQIRCRNLPSIVIVVANMMPQDECIDIIDIIDNYNMMPQEECIDIIDTTMTKI